MGGKFDKNNEVFSTTWDYLIVDEAHEGTQTELGKAVIEELTGENTKVLQLSGTPFNLLDDYSEELIIAGLVVESILAILMLLVIVKVIKESIGHKFEMETFLAVAVIIGSAIFAVLSFCSTI